jgi:hypothetical protein
MPLLGGIHLVYAGRAKSSGQSFQKILHADFLGAMAESLLSIATVIARTGVIL